MEKNVKKAVEEYQCTGCMNGSDTTCFKGDDMGSGCGSHYSGTMVLGGIGKLFLGLPKGFNRLGEQKDLRPKIYQTMDEYGGYNMWNVPTWKHKNKLGHTLVRGMMPRLNQPFLHIFLEDCLDKVDCYEVTAEDINSMD